jgi:hypothetical protein
MFPLLAPLPNTRAASALALFSFTRAFSQVCLHFPVIVHDIDAAA